MPERPDVPDEILAELRAACLALPDAYEEPAWTGTRWCVRKKNFAHVVAVADGWPPVYARELPDEAAADDGPTYVLTFRSDGDELDVLTVAGPPFFRPPWAPNVIGMVVDAATDWDEVAELVTESYCVMAPKKLVALLDRPHLPDDDEPPD